MSFGFLCSDQYQTPFHNEDILLRILHNVDEHISNRLEEVGSIRIRRVTYYLHDLQMCILWFEQIHRSE